MTKLRYPFGGGAAIRLPCAVCTGAGYERSTKSLERLPVLGGRCACNYEQDTPAAALAWDKLGADYRLLFESSGQYTPGGQHRRRVGSGADGGADAETLALSTNWQQERKQRSKIFSLRGRRKCDNLGIGYCDFKHWRQPAYAHREQVHSFLYVAAHRLTPKGVAV